MAEFLHEFELHIIAVICTLLGAGLTYLFRPRSKLVYSFVHRFTFALQPVPNSFGLAAAAALWVKNVGRASATEVEVTFNYKPQFYNLWPARPCEIIVDSIVNRYTLKFSSIAPQEELWVHMISSGQELPEVVSLRSKEGVAELISMRYAQINSKFVVAILWAFLLLGIATFIYFILFLIVPHVPFLKQS